MNEINKTSKLIFDPRVTRALLKMNGEPKFCPYCGQSLAQKCDCHKNIVIDVKPMRGSTEASIAVFSNNESFQKDLDEVLTKFKEKAENKKEQTVVDKND